MKGFFVTLKKDFEIFKIKKPAKKASSGPKKYV